MEAENKLYTDMHGNTGGQLPQDPPQYTATSLEQPAYKGYPPYPSTMAGAPYYAPPSGTEYDGGYGAQPSAPAKQQQQVAVMATNSVAPIYVYPAETYSGAIIYSCLVLWCCNFIFGLVGYALAAQARDTAVTDPEGARKLGRASYIVSSVGIVISIVIISVYFGFLYSPCYYYEGYCYNHADYYMSDCSAKGGVFDTSSGMCYYN